MVAPVAGRGPAQPVLEGDAGRRADVRGGGGGQVAVPGAVVLSVLHQEQRLLWLAGRCHLSQPEEGAQAGHPGGQQEPLKRFKVNNCHNTSFPQSSVLSPGQPLVPGEACHRLPHLRLGPGQQLLQPGQGDPPLGVPGRHRPEAPLLLALRILPRTDAPQLQIVTAVSQLPNVMTTCEFVTGQWA